MTYTVILIRILMPHFTISSTNHFRRHASIIEHIRCKIKHFLSIAKRAIKDCPEYEKPQRSNIP